MTVHHQLAAVLQEALQAAQTAGALPTFNPPEITIERPRDLAARQLFAHILDLMGMSVPEVMQTCKYL